MSDKHELEPAWIRDAQAAPVTLCPLDMVTDQDQVTIKLWETITAICEGETICCEYCGASFRLWPLKEWADHQIREHGENMTLQIRAGNALLCESQMNQAVNALFWAQFAARVSMRRRAWKMGYASEIEPPKPKGKIHIPN